MTGAMYSSRAISEVVSPQLEILAMKLLERRVTIMTGAGASMGSPSNLPSAAALSQLLADEFKDGFAAAALEGVESWDLLAVADAVAGPDPARLRLIQEKLARLAFDTASPNSGHRVLALLFAEGCIDVSMTINYDTCLERASIRLTDVAVEPCREAQDLQQGQNRGRLLKLHGCVKKPSTMRITSAQLDPPDQWAVVEIQRAAAHNALVIVGIGSLAPYMHSTVAKIYQYSPGSESVYIVSKTIDSTWNDLLGEENRATKLLTTAEAFFDELLRACLQLQFLRLRRQAAALDGANAARRDSDDDSTEDSTHFSSAIDETLRGLRAMDAESLVLCLRWGGQSEGRPNPLATGDRGLVSLLVLSVIQAALGGTLTARITENEALFLVGEVFVVFAVAQPSRTSAAIETEIGNRLTASRRRGALLGASPTVLVISHGHLGPLPPKEMLDDIVGETEANDLIGGADYLRVRWLDAGSLSGASNLDEARRLVAEAVA